MLTGTVGAMPRTDTRKTPGRELREGEDGGVGSSLPLCEVRHLRRALGGRVGTVWETVDGHATDTQAGWQGTLVARIVARGSELTAMPGTELGSRVR